MAAGEENGGSSLLRRWRLSRQAGEMWRSGSWPSIMARISAGEITNINPPINLVAK